MMEHLIPIKSNTMQIIKHLKNISYPKYIEK